MNVFRSRAALTALGATALLAVATAAPSVAATPTNGATGTGRAPSAALDWYDTTAETIATAGATTQVTNNRTWAVSWLAAARATRAVPDGVARADYQDAALASAVHDALVALAPARTEQLDASLRKTLDAIPDGAAETKGVAAGSRQAALALKSREGDGLDPKSVNAPFTVPPAAPGVWQPTPPAYAPATQYGNRLAKPFALRTADQYRLPAPPALDSRRYKADLAEVRAYGVREGSSRTARQTETANFWLGSSLTLYTAPLRVAVDRAPRSPADRARLVALFHIASVDTQIATSDSKYAHQRWRPVTAIRTGDIEQDAGWTPLHDTPAHPDYPSGHNTYSGAAEGVLNALAGPHTAPYELTSPTAPGVTRTYTDWHRLSAENVEARIYSGIHTRSADEAGIRLGKQVAAETLRHADTLLRPAS
ncbi:vanadium-dependent haloperoxidase [Streptomyces sp. NBC_01381]|uniref:vanadium-dependent haloperoxidase n=1 Tax=Streptomyces sp. NBC_01381 TaxID=2903845 RepID=UPI00225C320C|nr:vanadium-dependent haloperoxidase [Streptomyces sp. NBC_01381]MCX4671563.1 vanadium-dependent haloperoxidase [Streptomyces sp. NBC_01381]